MAANDYYNTQHGQPQPYGRQDAALPPLPGSQAHHAVSPISSPFDERQYHSSGALGGYPDTSYSNAPSNSNTQYPNRYDLPSGRPNDPFADQNAIPLHAQPKMDGHKPGDGSPTRYYADPEQYPLPNREKRRKKKNGWLSGRITWVVYLLTTVQVGVFVGELIKNGRLLIVFKKAQKQRLTRI